MIRTYCADCKRQTSLAEPGPWDRVIWTICERCRIASRRALADAKRRVARELGR